ncbi:YncE family protein [Labilithrix luteola]|nr:hypothetical protein [Labilithrix luteola]
MSFVSLAVALSACNVDDPPASTGGARGASCERFAVVRSDYASTQIALVDDGGRVLSANVVSSGSTPSGATSALSGDVVLPHDAPAAGKVVLIDRFPNGILTWLDAETGAVEGQLNVVPGFPANPHDYLDVAPGKAYVTRFGSNTNPGKVAFDEGGDLLVVDTARRSLSKRIDLSGYGGGVDPRPDRMTMAAGRAYVTLSRLDATFERGEDGLVVVIDVTSDEVVDTIPIPGLKNCTNLALSPDARALAVSCSGLYKVPGAAQMAASGVVVFELASKKELLRGPASTIGAALGSSLGFPTSRTVVAVANADAGDQILAIDLETAQAKVLHQTSPFAAGDMFCGCGGRCLVPDADAASLLAVDAERVAPLAALTGSGLPARAVSAIGKSSDDH